MVVSELGRPVRGPPRVPGSAGHLGSPAHARRRWTSSRTTKGRLPPSEGSARRSISTSLLCPPGRHPGPGGIAWGITSPTIGLLPPRAHRIYKRHPGHLGFPLIEDLELYIIFWSIPSRVQAWGILTPTNLTPAPYSDEDGDLFFLTAQVSNDAIVSRSVSHAIPLRSIRKFESRREHRPSARAGPGQPMTRDEA